MVFEEFERCKNFLRFIFRADAQVFLTIQFENFLNKFRVQKGEKIQFRNAKIFKDYRGI